MLTLLHPVLNIQSENRNFVQVTSACDHHTLRPTTDYFKIIGCKLKSKSAQEL